MKSILGMRRAGALRWIGVFAFALAPVLASAEEAKPVGPDEQEVKRKVKEAEERLRHERRQLHDALRGGGSADRIKELDKEVAEASGELAQARLRARDAERTRLLKNGYVISPDKLRAEWRKHALRIARLRRIRDLAVASNDGDSVARVDVLAAKETRRHESWIDRQRADDGAPVAPPSAAPAVSTAPAAPAVATSAQPPAAVEAIAIATGADGGAQ